MGSVRHVTSPAGFSAAGVKCGIKASGKNDLAVIVCDTDASAAIVTTRNQVVGAPVIYIRKIMPRGYGVARAMVVNSGCSNVCTGAAGVKDAQTMARLVAKAVKTDAKKVLVASTGIIGHRLPMDKVRAGIAAATASLGTDNDDQVVKAIMTTDTREKTALVTARIGGKDITVAGIVKGSGMIAPSMATMIGVITTDVAISPPALHKALVEVSNESFNAITVDSDTSTSDTVAVFASGLAGNKPISAGSADWRKFRSLLGEVCGELARSVVIDGEGATKLVKITVLGARNSAEARIAAVSVANSPLFKCAMHGGDPNWGRIAAALGKSSAKIDPSHLKIAIGGVTIFTNGGGRKFDLPRVESHLKGMEIDVECNLGLGKGSFTALTCDLSREYVAINADYST